MGKRGPKPKWVEDRNREIVEGLILRADGRYIAHDDRNRTFGRDRDDAIRRFRQWQARHRNERIHIPEITPLPAKVGRGKRRDFLPHIETDDGRPDGLIDIDNLLRFHSVPAPEFWDTVRQVILAKPTLAAQKTGIEQLAYLSDLKPPAPSSPLAVILETYCQDRANKVTHHEIHNSRLWWAEFVKTTGAQTIRDLTHESIRKYRSVTEAKQAEEKLSNVWTRGRFSKVKTIFNHALTELNLSKEDRETLTLLSLLKNPKKPKGSAKKKKTLLISREEMTQLLAKADVFEKALLLVALNCAYYQVDITRLKWEYLNFEKRTLVFEREKSTRLTASGSAVPRVAYLWTRTIAALKKLTKDSELVFPNMERHRLYKRFNRLRKKTDIKRNITFAHLRDSAITVASRSAPTTQVHALAGHSDTSVTWEYIERSPDFVKDACIAIENHFFGA